MSMKRVKRKPSKFGSVELADQLGIEFNLPMDQIADKFALVGAKDVVNRNPMLMHGKRVERMFESVIASLGQADLITTEDSGAAVYDDAPVLAPDYFVALKTGKKYLIEVKNRYVRRLEDPLLLDKGYLAGLKRYAELKGYPLLLAAYWPTLRMWTINKIIDIEKADGSIELRFVDALKLSVASEFGDKMVATVPPLIARLHADPAKPSGLSANGVAHFTTRHMSLYAEGKEILDEREKQVAMYFMFHSSWYDGEPKAVMRGAEVDYVEFVSKPEDEIEDRSEQPFKTLGTLAGMISSYYNWLTVADKKITRLTPNVEPSELSAGIGDNYQGKVLRLWYFNIQPNYESFQRDRVTPADL